MRLPRVINTSGAFWAVQLALRYKAWPVLTRCSEESLMVEGGEERGLLRLQQLKCMVQRSLGQNKRTALLGRKKKKQLTEQKARIKETLKEKMRVEGACPLRTRNPS